MAASVPPPGAPFIAMVAAAVSAAAMFIDRLRVSGFAASFAISLEVSLEVSLDVSLAGCGELASGAGREAAFFAAASRACLTSAW